MKKILVIAALLLGATAAYALLTRKQIVTAQEMTVIIDNTGFLGSGRGTGILLDSTHVLTCAHMVNQTNDEFMVLTYPIGRAYQASVEMVDKHDDIALLVLASSAPIISPVKFSNAEIGDEITVIGNALGSNEWVVTHGIVSASERGFLLTDALINPGNSGGPWLNNKGEVVGMTDWTIGPDDVHHERGICGGIDARKIQEVLDGYALAQALQGVLLK